MQRAWGSGGGIQTRATLVLRNIPRTALISDVRRMLDKCHIENVQNVYLDYHRFMPVGKAFVTFTEPVFSQPAFHRLKTAQMSGMPLDVTSTSTLDNLLHRSRGTKGLELAMARGALHGNGPNAGVGEHGKNVVMWGLPGKMAPDHLRNYLRSFRLASTEGGLEDILKIETPGRPPITSRYYVRTISPAEAHRLVRRLHMSSLDQHGRQYVVRARVL